MIGGEPHDFEAMKPIFEIMGENIVLQGPAGSCTASYKNV